MSMLSTARRNVASRWSPPKRRQFPLWPLSKYTVLFLASLAVVACETDAEDTPHDDPRTLRISSDVSCADCEIILEPIVNLGSIADTIALDPLSPVAVSGNEWLISALGPTLAVYDSTGELIRTFGQSGAGPGEFQGLIAGIHVGAGDTVHVLDANRHIVLSPELTDAIETIQLPFSVQHNLLLPRGRLVLDNVGVGGGQPLHLLDRDGSIDRSFGERIVSEHFPWDALRPLALDQRGQIWSSRVTEFRLDLWDVDGRRQRTLIRDADWFTPWAPDQDGGQSGGEERPRLGTAFEDGHNFLWIPIHILEDGTEDEYAERPVQEIDFSEIIDTIIEVIDLGEGKVVARHRFPHQLIFIQGSDDVLAAYPTLADSGVTQKRIVRLRLAGG